MPCFILLIYIIYILYLLAALHWECFGISCWKPDEPIKYSQTFSKCLNFRNTPDTNPSLFRGPLIFQLLWMSTNLYENIVSLLKMYHVKTTVTWMLIVFWFNLCPRKCLDEICRFSVILQLEDSSSVDVIFFPIFFWHGNKHYLFGFNTSWPGQNGYYFATIFRNMFLHETFCILNIF